MPTSSIYLAILLCAFGSSSTLVQGVFQQQQKPLFPSHSPTTTTIGNTMHSPPQYGRFLHLTDIHMDDHYKVGATITSFCHRDPKRHKKKKARKGKLAGFWGAPATDCDSAPHMVYHSIDWIAQEWKDKVDFVVWTGDNARHDTEPGKIRRSGREILQYNIKITDALQQAFKRSDNSSVPIVPCIGNNDIHPHNVLTGPTHSGGNEEHSNPQLVTYSNIWRDLIPKDQVATFRHGGYFSVNVAQGIRILSLNTLYFFNSNDAVGRCDAYGEPGWDHIQWLQRQLEQARSEGVKVYIMGHVPPTTKTFKRDCLHDYTRLALDYQDVIQAHFYGHANMDHFQILHRYSKKKKQHDMDDDDMDNDDDSGGGIHINGNSMGRKLRRQYKKNLKHYSGINDLVVIHVAPPILPVYNPGFRVNEYNADPASPRFGTWMKYTQWYSDLTHWNEQYAHDNTTRPTFQVEYATDVDYEMKDLSPQSWLDLARLFVQKSPAAHSLWSNYLENMVVQT